jgi:hypothetical protein
MIILIKNKWMKPNRKKVGNVKRQQIYSANQEILKILDSIGF